MFGFSWLDALLIIWLMWQLIYGLNAGLVVSLGGLAGFVAGAMAAFFAAPFVNQYAPNPDWRTVFVVGATVILIAIGHSIGIRIGRAIGKRVKFGPVRTINRILGGALNVAVAALIVSMLSFGVSNLGIPAVSKQLSDSVVLSKIDAWTPDPVKAAAAELRSLVLEEGIPQILNPGGPNVDVAVPDSSTDIPALNNAAKSVLKISGTAFQCGQNQTGTGFVVSPGRVVTNAHVVAGVSTPLIQTSGQGTLRARVVYFDPAKDLAVLAVDGLNVAPLPVAANLPAGAPAAFAGYPLGGPLQVKPARIISAGPLLVANIDSEKKSLLDVYQLAANVQSGNSGGPLLDTSGNVVGVIFAKSTTSDPLGFALTMDEAGPVIAAAPQLTSTVPSGSCSTK